MLIMAYWPKDYTDEDKILEYACYIGPFENINKLREYATKKGIDDFTMALVGIPVEEISEG